MLITLHPKQYFFREPLVGGRGMPRRISLIQKSHLPGIDEMRKAAVVKMYEGLSPLDRRRLRAQRAQRALDVIDLFHADLPIVIASMTERQRQGMMEVALMTNKMRHKLRGIANGEDKKSELPSQHEWCKEYGT